MTYIDIDRIQIEKTFIKTFLDIQFRLMHQFNQKQRSNLMVFKAMDKNRLSKYYIIIELQRMRNETTKLKKGFTGINVITECLLVYNIDRICF